MKVTFWNRSIAGGADTYKELIASGTNNYTEYDDVTPRELERILHVYTQETYSTLNHYIHPKDPK